MVMETITSLSPHTEFPIKKYYPKNVYIVFLNSTL